MLQKTLYVSQLCWGKIESRYSLGFIENIKRLNARRRRLDNRISTHDAI